MTSPRQSKARVVSVNVGPVREVTSRGRVVRTAIWKTPVAGPVAVRGVNVAGDDQADRTVHGGPDKAVYVYAVEDYAFWAARETFQVQTGVFGENLTVAGLDLGRALVGERWRVGTTLLEVAQPRLPCFKLGIRVGDPTFLKRFQAAIRPGAYLRIIEPGHVRSGDIITTASRPSHDVTIALMAESVTDPAKARAIQVASELPENWRP
jgi:MOSC domain-containing protein YiiM